MKIVLYGATGKAGSRILTELLARGHEVVAVVRNPDKLAPNDGLTVRCRYLASRQLGMKKRMTFSTL